MKMDIIARKSQIIEAIQAELDTASLLLIRGLQELQAMDMNYGSYFMPSQTLSQGLERIMKVLLFLSGIVNRGDLKNKYSHGLIKSWDKLIEHDIVRQIPDSLAGNILYILSEFGYNARYYYTSLLDGIPANFNPQTEWEKLENSIMDEKPQRYMMLKNGDDANVLINEIIRSMQISIEKIIKSLSVAIIEYEKREIGWVVPLVIKAFADLNNDSYGKNIYKEWPDCLIHVPQAHKRTCRDRVISLLHPFRKSKVVKKRNYNGKWPFRNIQKVRIEKRKTRKGTLHIVTINGYDCALDGRTADILNMARPYEAGLAIIGVSIQRFLDMAKEL